VGGAPPSHLGTAAVLDFAAHLALDGEPLSPEERLWWAHELGLGVCLADDMGLGKTLQVLALLLLRRRSSPRSPALLVVPASGMAADELGSVFGIELETGTDPESDSPSALERRAALPAAKRARTAPKKRTAKKTATKAASAKRSGRKPTSTRR
jgi:SNF2-related domain